MKHAGCVLAALGHSQGQRQARRGGTEGNGTSFSALCGAASKKVATVKCASGCGFAELQRVREPMAASEAAAGPPAVPQTLSL